MYTSENMIYIYTAHSPCFFPPLLVPFCSPFHPSLLTWNPPLYDRIRPPRSQVAHKLTSPFPSPVSYTPLPKIPTPRGFPDPNIHSLGQHCEPDPQARAQAWFLNWSYGNVICRITWHRPISFNVIVVKTLKPVFYFSRDGVSLNLKNKANRSYSSSLRIVWAYFRPLLHLAGQSLLELELIRKAKFRSITRNYVTQLVTFFEDELISILCTKMW
jgi:hypothetical protein